MPIYALDDVKPVFEDQSSVWIAPDAQVIGNVHIARDVGIWFGVVIRCDNEPIVIGAGSNVQEHVIMHTDPGFPLTVGRGCTIGHRATLHGCTLADNCLVGMGATILNGAKIGENCLVGAGALITEGKEFPPGSLIVGTPAKVVRALRADEIAGLKASAAHYINNQRRFSRGCRLIDV